MSSITARADRAPLERLAEGRLLGGVCAGVARHLDLPPAAVRVVAAVLAGNGLGVLLYLAAWILLPAAPSGPGGRRAPALPWPPNRLARLWAGPDSRGRRWPLVGYALLGAALGSLFKLAGPLNGSVFPLSLALCGALLIWLRAPAERRARWTADARRYTGRVGVRAPDLLFAAAGVLLVVTGATVFLASHHALAQAGTGALTVLVTAVGALLVAGPWLVRLRRDLAAERWALVRQQERAELAAQVHDSVLQTLTLVQARADDPAAVRRLARRQERELRDWLYAPAAAGPESFAAGLRRLCREVEDEHEVGVELVVVGEDPVLDGPLVAIAAAAREAVLNAAKSAGVAEVSVFAEVTADRAEVFVRDRGRGFDPAAVPADRHGLADSIVGRMARVDGRAVVRSSPGSGTEIELSVPRERS